MRMAAPSDQALAHQGAFAAHDDAVAEALGALNASGARLVGLVRQCIDESWWSEVACRSPEHWVTARCGLAPARSARLVRIARRIHEFPATEAAFVSGLVSEDHLDVIVGHAHPTHDPSLAVCAPNLNVGQLRRYIASLPLPEPDPLDDCADDAAGDGEAPTRGETVGFGWDDDGRYRGRVDLGAQLGSLLERGLRSARARLFRERTGKNPDDHDAAVAAITTTDALERLVHAGLAALDPATAARQRPSDRHQILIHVDAEHPERSRINLGPVLGRNDRQLLTCDADVRAIWVRDGRPIAQGRRHRTADPILRALIEDRDGGCVIPGCGRHAFVHIHHLVHWEQFGPTNPDNLVAVCTEHHHQLHNGTLRLIGNPEHPDGLTCIDHHGRPLPQPRATPTRGLPEAPRPCPGPDRSEPLRLHPPQPREPDDDDCLLTN